MKTALVTGISGYLGSHISKQLKKNGWKVLGMDIKRPKHEYYDYFKACDVRDRHDVDTFFWHHKIDAVFHF